jgi:DNA-binding MarR family transcriptional regulator
MDGRHWPDPEQAHTFRVFLEAANLLLDRLDRELQRTAEMPLAYFEILACLAQAPDRTLRMSDLAEHLHASRSRLSHSVARLEERGWVQRISCPTDKRGTYAELTRSGVAALDHASPGLARCVDQHLFAQLTPAQMAELRCMSEAIAGHLCTLKPDGPVEQF